uniref:Mesoderm posterior aa n=1 Tax=Neolamprologus brichardi TaxID=32507 RepID=A0A3Q4GQ28_NEOBR
MQFYLCQPVVLHYERCPEVFLSYAGYSSTGNSLSPTSSVDSFCFSPTSLLTFGSEQDPLDCLIFNTPAAPHLTHQTPLCSKSSSATKKSRSRYPGKKRQTASEREKLRMRDLTKALHHLRSYLPHSVAPAGQTLTKIEILRLTIRYISFLSAQLAANYSPEEPSCNTMSKAQQPFLQNSYQVYAWSKEQPKLFKHSFPVWHFADKLTLLSTLRVTKSNKLKLQNISSMYLHLPNI